MDRFFRNVEVLHLGIKCVKNIWNLKRVWITPKSFCDFQAYCQVFSFVRNDISHTIIITGNVLCFLTYCRVISQNL